jgi:hypothetical protein
MTHRAPGSHLGAVSAKFHTELENYISKNPDKLLDVKVLTNTISLVSLSSPRVSTVINYTPGLTTDKQNVPKADVAEVPVMSRQPWRGSRAPGCAICG